MDFNRWQLGLAYHYTEAGLLQEAIVYWQQAGQRASERSAYVEAIAHLNKGLELLFLLPDTSERIQRELSLQTILGPALMTTKGWASSEVERAYSRARELCQQVRELPQVFPILRGLWVFYLVRAEFRTALEVGDQLLHLAQSVQDSAFLLEAHRSLGTTLFHLGELTQARVNLEQGIALYDPQQHRSHAFQYGQDTGMAGRSYVALVLWHLGYPDQALQQCREALLLAEEPVHPFSLAYALGLATRLHQFRGEAQMVRERTERAFTLATEQGFPFFSAWGMCFQG